MTLGVLLESSVAARFKLSSFLALLMLLENLPLVLGLFGPKSIVGRTIGVNHEVSTVTLEGRRESALAAYERETAIRAAMAEAMRAALASPELQRSMAEQFALRHNALVPVHVAGEMMAAIDAAAQEARRVIDRNPDEADHLSEIWRRAIEEVLARFGPTRPQPA